MDATEIRVGNINVLADHFGRDKLASMMGYEDTNYLNQLCAGLGSFGPRTARKAEAAVGMPRGTMDHINAAATFLGVRELEPQQSSNAYPARIDLLSVPIFNAKGAMGPGIPIPDADVILDQINLAADWVRQTLPKITAPRNLKFITGKGPSMEPTFSDGDILLVDTGVVTVDIDAVYVLSGHGRLFIKRVRQRIDGEFEISSDNPSIKTSDTLSGDHEISVHGRVVWAWNGKRL